MSRPPGIEAKRARHIRRRYSKQRASMQEIAREEGVSVSVVKRFMERHGIAVRRRGPRAGKATNTVLTEREKGRLFTLLKAGKRTQAEIARKFGISKQRVRYFKVWLKEQSKRRKKK